MFTEGVNSGLPVLGNPNDKGLGKVISGAASYPTPTLAAT